MSQIMKTFTGIFIVLFMIATSMGMLGAFLQVSNARNFHASVIDELENSNYCESVIWECVQLAQENDYELELTLYQDTGGYVVCSSQGNVWPQIKDIDMAKVDMEFVISIPFLGMEKEQKISGYGR